MKDEDINKQAYTTLGDLLKETLNGRPLSNDDQEKASKLANFLRNRTFKDADIARAISRNWATLKPKPQWEWEALVNLVGTL